MTGYLFGAAVIAVSMVTGPEMPFALTVLMTAIVVIADMAAYTANMAIYGDPVRVALLKRNKG